MRASVHRTSTRGSASLLEFPFDFYTDSPDDAIIDDEARTTSAAESERVDDEEVRASQWRRVLNRWRKERDEAALHLLSEQEQSPTCRKRLQRCWWSKCLMRAFIGFFVML